MTESQTPGQAPAGPDPKDTIAALAAELKEAREQLAALKAGGDASQRELAQHKATIDQLQAELTAAKTKPASTEKPKRSGILEYFFGQEEA